MWSWCQASIQMGVKASCGLPLPKENCFIFHMLPYKLLIRADPIAHFGWSLFKFSKPGWSDMQPFFELVWNNKMMFNSGNALCFCQGMPLIVLLTRMAREECLVCSGQNLTDHLKWSLSISLFLSCCFVLVLPSLHCKHFCGFGEQRE